MVATAADAATRHGKTTPDIKATITQAQANKLTARKDSKRWWPEHYLYLVAVSDATGRAEALAF